MATVPYLYTHKPRQTQFRARRAKVTGCVVLHSAESAPDTVGPDDGAINVARFIQNRLDYGSYHGLGDSDSRLRVVGFPMACYGDGTGSNEFAIHLSLATQAHRWPTLSKGWKDGAIKQLALEARDAAIWLKREHGITLPARRITKAQSDQGMAGFISHADRDPSRRSDPGKDFPWEQFFAEFKKAMEPGRVLVKHTAKIATYNLKVGRATPERKKWLIDKIKNEGLQVVGLQEAEGYTAWLKDVAKACGMDLYQVKTSRDTGNCAILISKKLGDPSLTKQIFRQAKKMWWGAKTGTWRAPRGYLEVKRAGVWWGCGHRVAYQFDPRNVAANVEYDKLVADTINSREKARHIVFMDWNDGIRNEDIQKVKNAVDGHLHGVKGNSGIDYWLTVDGETNDAQLNEVDITDERQVADKGGSDHHMKIARAHWTTLAPKAA